jgi:hypothetical protein
MAREQSPFASFIKRHTEALEMLWRLATCVNDNPERRSCSSPARIHLHSGSTNLSDEIDRISGKTLG